MNTSLVKPTKFLLVLSLIVFLLFLSFGFFHFSMSNESMTDCPLMGMSTFCQMNPLEHIAAWQILFTSLPAKSAFNLLGFLFLALIVSISLKNRWQNNELWQQFHFRIQRTESLIYKYLQEAFSDGILNPKIYSLS